MVARKVEEKVDEKRRKIEQKIEQKQQRVAEKVGQKRQRAIDQIERQMERHGERLERIAPVAQVAYEIWTRERPGTRRPRHTLDQIADAALHVADTEGVDALSMRRLAAELGSGTMTLYHYVHTKDELMALLADRVMSELLLDDDELPEGWREAMTAIAHRTRDVLLAHPWIFDTAEDPTMGPSGVRHFDQSLRAVASLDIGVRERLDILQAVDEYVFGYCVHRRGEVPEAIPDDLRGYVEELARDGEYPSLQALLEEYGADDLWAEVVAHERDPSRFDRNLSRILDGIERDLPPGAT
jgi:AcrR family transcriptional regulator